MSIDHMKHSTLTEDIDETLLHKWDLVISTVPEDRLSVEDLDGNIADMYKFDFNGLLQYLNIPESYWFVHARINNFKTSSDYNGEVKIFILDAEYLNTIHSMFLNNSI